MTKTADRQTIRTRAASQGASYRIRANGEVHFYGIMPSSPTVGWYFVGWSPAEVAAQIRFEDEMMAGGSSETPATFLY